MNSNNPKDPIVNLIFQAVYIHYYHHFFKKLSKQFHNYPIKVNYKLELKGEKKTIQKQGKYLTYEGKTTHKLFGWYVFAICKVATIKTRGWQIDCFGSCCFQCVPYSSNQGPFFPSPKFCSCNSNANDSSKLV